MKIIFILPDRGQESFFTMSAVLPAYVQPHFLYNVQTFGPNEPRRYNNSLLHLERQRFTPTGTDSDYITLIPVRPNEKESTPPTTGKRLQSAAVAGGLLTTALLLRRLPAHPSSSQLISSDWKVWAKVLLGTAAIDQANKALNWKPPTWLGALTTVSVIYPLSAGFNKSVGRKLLLLAPMVAGLVETAQWGSEKLKAPLKKEANVPPVATQLGLSAIMTMVGMLTFPKALNYFTLKGLLGNTEKTALQKALNASKEQAHKLTEAGKKTATNATETASAAGATAAVCARGCCASAVCVSELGEYASATWSWLSNDKSGQPEHQTGKNSL